MKKGMVIIMASLMSVLLAGCSLFSKAEEIIDPPVCGGVINNSYNAPKEIKSETITEFSANFFRYGEFDSSGDRSYWFSVKKTGGELTLSEGSDNVSCAADDGIMADIQEIIKKHNLTSLNGTAKHTAGLPSEYAPNSFRAVYDSGEELYFSTNNDPTAKWSEELLDLFAGVFHDNGIFNFDPPEGSADVIRFELDCKYGSLMRSFNELLVPIGEEADRTLEDVVTNGYSEDSHVTYISYYEYDLDDTECENVIDIRALPDEDYYSELSRLVQEYGLKDHDNGTSFPSGYDYNGTPQYFSFYVEFAYGNLMYGFSDDPETVKNAEPLCEALCEYVKGYVEGNK